jgi:phosphohistidine phosphatase
MLRLMLLRHAKSSWAEPGMDDQDRPLNARGLAAAPLIGAYMRKHEMEPTLVLCSPARRARETWALVAAELKAPPTAVFDDAIYDFGDGGRLMHSLKTRAAGAPAVLIVGHNPAIENLASRLIGHGGEKPRKRLASKYPTGALAVIDFGATSWHEIEDGSGTLTMFIRPRDVETDE